MYSLQVRVCNAYIFLLFYPSKAACSVGNVLLLYFPNVHLNHHAVQNRIVEQPSDDPQQKTH